ncbi:hypothetical protein [Actinacidiphila oryziradicis]|uniref:hypothetical protein n=1 Tax=Actinacidiphila oryziradicis TaxID=2571141 RepID=UPI001B80D237|nr:hypothetical protein [Actinacidiphila oryziradicis]
MPEQRERLEQLGVRAHHRPGPDVREGSVTVPRGHVEALEDGSGEVKLGVFLSNTKSRRAKLTADKLRGPRRTGTQLGVTRIASAGRARVLGMWW